MRIGFLLIALAALAAFGQADELVAPLDGARELAHLGDSKEEAKAVKAATATAETALKTLTGAEKRSVEGVDVAAFAKANPLKGGKGTCFQKLTKAQGDAKARLDETKKTADSVSVKFKAAMALKKSSETQVATFTAQMNTAKVQLVSEKKEYKVIASQTHTSLCENTSNLNPTPIFKVLHGNALNSYDVAKTDLASYKNQRKKVLSSLSNSPTKCTILNHTYRLTGESRL